MADVELGYTTCWCGTPFALPQQLLNAAINAGHTIYCPHGHPVVWKETEVDRLRRERDRLKQDAARIEQERWDAIRRADKAEAATKRLKKRASAGTCPCCQRTIKQLASHIKSKHPEFYEQQSSKGTVGKSVEQVQKGGVVLGGKTKLKNKGIPEHLH